MKYLIALFIILLSPYTIKAQQYYALSGYIYDKDNKESLIGATVFDSHTGHYSVTNQSGYYNISISAQTDSLVVSCLGYAQKCIHVSHEAKELNVFLDRVQLELSAAFVDGSKPQNVRKGTLDIYPMDIKLALTPFGVLDPMKTVQMQPGIIATSEAKSDLSVRGGGPDQNLILLDGIPIYDANHLFGFVSIFDTDAIKKISIFKRGFPARYGGRLSSIVDISTKDGNKMNYEGRVSVGLLSAEVEVEGPIAKGKTSFFITARRSLADVLLIPIMNSIDDEESKNELYYYDISVKIHNKVNSSSAFSIMFYHGEDLFSECSDKDILQRWRWGNTLGSIRYDQAIGRSLFWENRFSISSYRNVMDCYNASSVLDKMNYYSRIQDIIASTDMVYGLGKSTSSIKFGGQYCHHQFNANGIIDSDEVSVYSEADWRKDNLSLTGGLCLGLFLVGGKNYRFVEPRITIGYNMKDNLSVGFSYDSMHQPIHMLSGNSVLLQSDVWVPSTTNISPACSNQFSLSLDYQNPEILDLCVEGFLKRMKGVIDYVDGAALACLVSGWEDTVVSGLSRSYGMEISVSKTVGHVDARVAYTLSRTDRKHDGINDGKWFPEKYDRRHVLYAEIRHRINSKVDFKANWSFLSGNVLTIPMMTFVGAKIPDYPFPLDEMLQLDSRNNFRLPSNHHLDINFIWTPNPDKKRHGTWNLGIYNVYCHSNPYRVYPEEGISYDEKGEKRKTWTLKQISLFPLLPSISYSYKF